MSGLHACSRGPRLAWRAVFALVVASAGCAPDAVIPPPRAVAAPEPAPQEPECAPISLTPLATAPANLPAARSLGPPVDLAVLVRSDAPKRPSPKPRRRIDLGHVSRVVGPHPGTLLDMGRLSLPHDVPRPELTPDLQRAWDRNGAARQGLRLVLVRRALADRKERACREAACADLACMGKRKREIDDEARAVRDRWARERRELVASLRQQLATAGDKAPAGVLLALASTLDEMARKELDDGLAELTTSLKEPIALYERAAALAGPASDIGWFARYLLGAALEDTGVTAKAKAVFVALAQASRAGSRTAEAAYRAATLEQAPGDAADAYQRAAAAAPKGSPTRVNSLLRWSRSALAAERPTDALTAGLLLCDEVVTRGDDGWDGFLIDAADAMAEAFGRLIVARPRPPLPEVPAVVFASIAARVAENASRRFDVAQAIHAWKAIVAHAPDAKEASAALAGLAAVHERAAEGSEIEGRLAALLRDCGRDHPITQAPLELTLAVDAAAAGPAKVTARPAKPDPSSSLLRCLEARGPAYFVDAPADLRAKLTLTNQ